MAAIQTMSIPQFLSGNYKIKSDPIIDKLMTHFKKHRVKYRILGNTIIVIASAAIIAPIFDSHHFIETASASSLPDLSHTPMDELFPDESNTSSVSATSSSIGIDAGGRAIYRKLVNVGKWIIIVKGGWDTIMSMVKGDTESAKKSFFSYILIYLVLLGLPFALDQVDNVFKGI